MDFEIEPGEAHVNGTLLIMDPSIGDKKLFQLAIGNISIFEVADDRATQSVNSVQVIPLESPASSMASDGSGETVNWRDSSGMITTCDPGSGQSRQLELLSDVGDPRRVRRERKLGQLPDSRWRQRIDDTRRREQDLVQNHSARGPVRVMAAGQRCGPWRISGDSK